MNKQHIQKINTIANDHRLSYGAYGLLINIAYRFDNAEEVTKKYLGEGAFNIEDFETAWDELIHKGILVDWISGVQIIGLN